MHTWMTLYFGGMATRLAIIKLLNDRIAKAMQDEEGKQPHVSIVSGGNGFVENNAKPGGLFSGGSKGILDASGYSSLPVGLFGHGTDPISAMWSFGGELGDYNPLTGLYRYIGRPLLDPGGEGTGADGQAGVGGGVTGENSGFSGLNKALGIGFSIGMTIGPLAPIGMALNVMGVKNPFGYGLKDLAKDVATALGIATDPNIADPAKEGWGTFGPMGYGTESVGHDTDSADPGNTGVGGIGSTGTDNSGMGTGLGTDGFGGDVGAGFGGGVSGGQGIGGEGGAGGQGEGGVGGGPGGDSADGSGGSGGSGDASGGSGTGDGSGGVGGGP